MSKAIYNAMIELQFLNYIFKTNSMQSVILNNVTEEHFTTYKEHFNFIKEYYDKYNQLPSKETFQSKFSDKFEWLTISDPEEYLLDKLRDALLYRKLIDDYKEFSDLIKSGQTDKAVERMSEVSQKYLKQKQTACVDLISNAQLRYDAYMDRVNNHEKSFIPTGIKELDEIIGGWDTKNESAVIAARTGLGKSWWLIYFALNAAKHGFNVGFYSGEMELDLVGYRLDTFLGNLPNGSLTRGNNSVQLQYKNYIDSLNQQIPGHIYCITPDMLDGSATVSKIRAFIEKYDIEIMFVDQFSLLEDERRGKSPREQMSNISKDLRALQRLKKIPIISAAQLNREDTSTEGPTTKHISESDRVGQDATTILFIERKESNVIFTIGKARNAKTGAKLTYTWNINMGTLHYIPTEQDAKKGAGAEELAAQYNDSDKSNNVF